MTAPDDSNTDRLHELRQRYGSQRQAAPAAPEQTSDPSQQPPQQQQSAPRAPLGGVPGPQAQPQDERPAPPRHPQQETTQQEQTSGQYGAPVQADPMQAPTPAAYEQQEPRQQQQSQSTPPQRPRPAPEQRPQPTIDPSYSEPVSSTAAPSFRASSRPEDSIDYYEDPHPYSPDDRPRADESPAFDEVEVAGRSGKATRGFKGWMNRTLGTSIPPGEDELLRNREIGIINSTIRYPQVVGFYGAKGGVGKSTFTQILGSTISRYRSTGGGMVGIDIDANSSLLSLMEPNTPNPQISSVARMARDREIRTASDINSHLVFNNDNFAVLPGVAMTDDNPITPQELRRVLDVVVRNYTLVGLDFPGSPEVPLAMQTLRWIDYLVFVVAVSPVSIGNAKRELRRISEQCPSLVANATVVLNHGGQGSSRASVQNLDKHVQTIKNMSPTGELEVFEVNFDPHLAEAARLELGRTETSSQDQFLHIAAHVIAKLPKGQPNFLSHPLQ